MASIPFFLINGFLGSGKTTLLKNFLNTYADTKRIAVIQNEFAPGNVDGKELRQTGKTFEILEINSGSVFCVCLLADFIKSLGDLIESCHPDAVILEATGLADPIAIGQLLQAPTLRNKIYLAYIWTIIDATNFIRMEKTVTRIAHQIRVADTVIINKIDKNSDELDGIESRIKELNPFAEIVSTAYCKISFEHAFSDINQNPVALRISNDLAQFESGGRPDIGSAVIRTTNSITRDKLNQFLKNETANAYRLKGFVVLNDGSCVAVQSCFGETKIDQIKNYTGPTEVIAIGPDVDAAEFTKRFYKLL